MKILIWCTCLCILVATTLFVTSKTKELSHKNEIVKKILLYQDSIGMVKKELADLSGKYVNRTTYKEENEFLLKRVPMRVKIWHYQWKIDSLNMRFKQY